MKRRKRPTRKQRIEGIVADLKSGAWKQPPTLTVRAIEVAHYPAIGQVNFSVPVQRDR